MMKHKIINLIILIFLISPLSFYGCALAVLGVGAAGAGAFAYFNGKLIKTYEASYKDTVRASSYTLEELKIPITQTFADELTTEIRAERPNGTPVVIEVVRIDDNYTQVAVRTGSLGVWEKRVSEQIHGYINQHLGKTTVSRARVTEDLARDETQSVSDEAARPEIIEENLDEAPAHGTAHAESTAGTGHRQQAAPTPEFVQIATDSIFIIFFEQNSNDLTEETIKKLDRVFEILQKNPNAEIVLNGYSDSIGAASYNDMISEIRANAVKSYLVGKGIEPARIKAFGHGSQKFLGSNKSEEGRQLNRRVEIELVNP
jgi:outer membrane protein OmpA-like peptidoglycan-associated protein